VIDIEALDQRAYIIHPVPGLAGHPAIC
jgi:hypothetical protein